MRCAAAAIQALALAVLAAPARASVLTVSPAGLNDFHQIQDAVAAAADGDIILVKPGDYGPFVVADKALDIEADGGEVTVDGGIAVTGLAAGKAVVLRGIDAFAPLGPDAIPGLAIQDCAGHVRVELGRYQGAHEGGATLAFPGTLISGSPSVSLHNCRVVGGKNILTSLAKAGDGLDIGNASNVSLWECSFGGEQNYSVNGLPGAGASVDQGTLFASGTLISGGSENGYSPMCKAGAVGLELRDGAQARLLDDAITGGAGSAPVPPLCSSGGEPGLDIDADGASGSSYELLPGTAREFVATSPVRENQTLTFTFHGEPLDNAILIDSFSTQYLWLSGLHGTLLAGSPFATLLLGTTNTSGNLSLSTTVPELGAGVTGITLYCQGFFYQSGIGKYVGPLSPLLLLDAAY